MFGVVAGDRTRVLLESKKSFLTAVSSLQPEAC